MITEDTDGALAAISSVLKIPIAPRDLKSVNMTYARNRLSVAYKGHAGFITAGDARNWHTSIGEIIKVLSRAQGKGGHAGAPGGDWVKGESLQEQQRLMGIGPSFREQAYKK